MGGYVEGGEVPFSGPNAGQVSLPDDVMEAGLRQMMLGDTNAQINLRAPTEQESQGYSNHQRQDFPNEQAPSLEELAAQEQAGFQPQVPDGYMLVDKQKYGQSENEKGALRSELAQRDALLAQLQAQQQFLMGQMQSIQNQPARPQMQPAQNWGPAPRLFNKDKGDLISVEDIETTLLPALAQTWQLAEQSQKRAEQLEQELANSRKAQAGITPVVEMQLMTENPWLQMTQGSARIDAMASILQAKRAAQAAAQPAPIPAPAPAYQPAQAAVRRVTFVEGAQPTARTMAPTADPNANFQAQWQATFSLPLEGGKREAAQRALLVQAGAQQHTGFRDPSILTR